MKKLSQKLNRPFSYSKQFTSILPQNNDHNPK
jgi:hypothetical protein